MLLRPYYVEVLQELLKKELCRALEVANNKDGIYSESYAEMTNDDVEVLRGWGYWIDEVYEAMMDCKNKLDKDPSKLIEHYPEKPEEKPSELKGVPTIGEFLVNEGRISPEDLKKATEEAEKDTWANPLTD